LALTTGAAPRRGDDKCHRSLARADSVCHRGAIMPSIDMSVHDSAGASEAVGSWRLLRLAELAVFTLTVALAGVEVGRIAVIYGGRQLLIAAVATAVFLPLHVWHLRYGMRGERPPRSGVTLAAIAIVQLAALALIGPAWAFMLAALATSSLIVLPRPWSWLAVVACVCAPLAANLLHPAFTESYGVTAFYLMWSVTYRACLQFTLVWLVAGAHALVASRTVMAHEAAEREHARLEAAMSRSLERSLGGLADEAQRARAAMLEPGVSMVLLALDRVIGLATEATDELRRVVTQARTVAPVVDPAAELARMTARARTPVGQDLTVAGARWGFVAVQLCVFAVVPLAAVGAFGGSPSSAVVYPAWLVVMLVQLSSLQAVAHDDSVRWPYGRLILTTAISATMIVALGAQWRDLGWYVGIAIAVALRGRTRLVALGALFVCSGLIEVWESLAYDGLGGLTWDFCYGVTQGALAVIAAYGAARLVTALNELDRARDRHVQYAVQAERRRAWGDLHDVLGQTLTAITLKADLARRMVRRSPERSLAELDELTELAGGQAHELGVIARGERTVSFDDELNNAVSLLAAAGIRVTVTVDTGANDLDEPTSRLLGWTVREGTTNILRHTRARRVWIEAWRESADITLELRNDGVRSESGPGTGLRSLAERAREHHGQADTWILPNRQFILRVVVREPVAV
jgi:two-component system sensor histidine kinase DesK